eukprot:GHVU01091191.1.p1 GENE.GHVU01091191.1~~GHVU01091191.1.p1  ORF type:complete len:363 (+),score=17.14 GHVU01091191.1:290-1378(+)
MLVRILTLIIELTGGDNRIALPVITGSVRQQTNDHNSDIDIAVIYFQELPVVGSDDYRIFSKKVLSRIGGSLRTVVFIDNIELRAKAHIPVLKLTARDRCDSVEAYEIDIIVDDGHSLYGTRLIGACCNVDYRVRELILRVKRWSGQHNIRDGCSGISGFGWTVIVLYFLQCVWSENIGATFLPDLQIVLYDAFPNIRSDSQAAMFWDPGFGMHVPLQLQEAMNRETNGNPRVALYPEEALMLHYINVAQYVEFVFDPRPMKFKPLPNSATIVNFANNGFNVTIDELTFKFFSFLDRKAVGQHIPMSIGPDAWTGSNGVQANSVLLWVDPISGRVRSCCGKPYKKSLSAALADMKSHLRNVG